MRNLILVIVISVITVTNVVSQDLIYVNSIEENVYYPNNITIYQDSLILISDLSFEDPIYMLNLNNNEIVNSIPFGEGPGGLSTSYKNIGVYDDNIYVWDPGRQFGFLYNEKLEYLSTISFETNNKIYSSIPLGKKEFVLISEGDKFLEFISITNGAKHKTNKKYHIEENYFNDYKNFLLKQDLEYTTFGDTLVFTHNYTSDILLFSKKGFISKKSEPYNIKLDQKTDNEIQYLPDLMDHPLCVLDIETYKNQYIFVLFNGNKVTKEKVRKNFMDPNILVEEAQHSKKILVYNKRGEFLKEISLKNYLKEFDIKGNKLIGVNNLGEKSKILIFDVK